jgi:hypothetical protein
MKDFDFTLSIGRGFSGMRTADGETRSSLTPLATLVKIRPGEEHDLGDNHP